MVYSGEMVNGLRRIKNLDMRLYPFISCCLPPLMILICRLLVSTMPFLNDSARLDLVKPVTKEEVRCAVMSMRAFKAPDPNGFQAFFFKCYWHIIGFDLWKLVVSAFANGTIDPKLVETLIVLIPKSDQSVHLKSFRPINFYNVVYKVITKVIVNRLRPHLDDLINLLQGSFIPGRGTTENVLVAQEVLIMCIEKKLRRGFIAFKVDLEKTYDRVDLHFL